MWKLLLLAAPTLHTKWSGVDASALPTSQSSRVVSGDITIMAAVALGACGTSHVVFIKELGLGTAVAVLIDAFVIRALLVPALMALLGGWN